MIFLRISTFRDFRTEVEVVPFFTNSVSLLILSSFPVIAVFRGENLKFNTHKIPTSLDKSVLDTKDILDLNEND